MQSKLLFKNKRDMNQIMEKKIKTLDKNTHLFYGHEYSFDNFKF